MFKEIKSVKDAWEEDGYLFINYINNEDEEYAAVFARNENEWILEDHYKNIHQLRAKRAQRNQNLSSDAGTIQELFSEERISVSKEKRKKFISEILAHPEVLKKL